MHAFYRSQHLRVDAVNHYTPLPACSSKASMRSVCKLLTFSSPQATCQILDCWYDNLIQRYPCFIFSISWNYGTSFIFLLLHFQCSVFVPAVILLSTRNWASWSNRLLTFYFQLLRLFHRIKATCKTSAACRSQAICIYLWTVPVTQDRNFLHTNGQLMCYDSSFKNIWHICNEKAAKIHVTTLPNRFLTACNNFSSTEFHGILQTSTHPSFSENRTEITITVFNRTCVCVHRAHISKRKILST
jgi:hypothetical protein